MAMTRLLKEDLLDSLIKLFVVLVCAFNLFEYVFLIPKLLTSWQYIEPAENENLALSWAISHGLAGSLDQLAAAGIVPVYPDFYHRLSAIFGPDALLPGRLISVASYFATALISFLFVKRRTGLWPLAILVSLIVFGHPAHSLYFLMNRVDTLYVFLGFSALVVFYWDLDVGKDLGVSLSEISIKRYCLAGVLLGFAVMVKQTAIVFAVVIFCSFVIDLLASESLKNLNRFLVTLISLAVTIGAYSAFISDIGISGFVLGLDLFGEAPWNIPEAYKRVVVHYGYVLFLLVIMMAVYGSRKGAISQISLLYSFVLILVVFTLKLWTNHAAFSNNFILIPLLSVLIIASSWGALNKVTKSLCAVTLLAFAIWSNAGEYTPDVGIKGELVQLIKAGSYRYQYAKKTADANKIGYIANYIKDNDGSYLTNRLDNYLVLNGREVSHEDSVLAGLMYDPASIDAHVKNQSLAQEIKRHRERVRENIVKSNYKGILLGISAPLFLSAFPEIKEYYAPVAEEKIRQGVFDFNIRLYVPKSDSFNTNK